MKYIKITLAAILSMAFASAQTPVTAIPSHLSIGEVATVEALALATNIRVVCGQPSSSRPWFSTEAPLIDLATTKQVMATVANMSIVYPVDDVKADVVLQAYITGADGTLLFRSGNTFRMEKVVDPSTNLFKWEPPYYAGKLSFDLMDSAIYFAGATEATLTRCSDGQVHNLDVSNGYIHLPGWMNQASEFTELVINRNLRYDMNTGLRLEVANCRPAMLDASFSKIQPVVYQGDKVEITSYPQYGYMQSFEVDVFGRKYFRLEVQIGNNWFWINPIAVRIASLEDLRPGNQGWTTIPYSEGMTIPVASEGTYFIILEYQDGDIGSANGAITRG